MTITKKMLAGHDSSGSSRPLIMGVVNVTPDSFFDGNVTFAFDKAVAQAGRMLEAGADIIDIGGESTRPGQRSPVTTEEEIDRVAGVIEYTAGRLGGAVSCDTSNPEVMKVAIQAGACMINDIRALTRPEAPETVADLGVPVALMHSLETDPDPGFVPQYTDVVQEVSAYLSRRLQACVAAGVREENIILDPGFGGGLFGKTTSQSLQMVQRFAEFHRLKRPLLAGVSRKSVIGDVCDRSPAQRLPGSLALAVLLAQAGVHVIRVHDPAETLDVLKVIQAVRHA